MPAAPKPPSKDEQRLPKAPPTEEPAEHSGFGAGSALQRLKQWERSRAAQRGKPRDKPKE